MASRLNNSWDNILKEEFELQYFKQLKSFLVKEYKEYKVYPPKNQILAAFEYTPYENVKVVIIGQDPYYNENQANGLAFSVNKGIDCPASLQNIYKALNYDLNIEPIKCGDLTNWARQGVLLLNTTLTVRAKAPQSHLNKGWETFTDNVIKLLSNRKEPMVFMLWGNNAKKKEALIDTNKHLVLKSVHPSPLSFYHGFLECKHFSKANDFLIMNRMQPIDWSKRSD